MDKCPKCNSYDVCEFASKYTEKGYWCDDCGNEWEVEQWKDINYPNPFF